MTLMQVSHGIKRIDRFYGRSAVTIGNFEGFHLGHQKILKTLVDEAARRGLYSVVLTFTEHPLKVLKGREPEKLNLLSDKVFQFRQRGIDLVIFVDFTKEFARTEPLMFIRILYDALAPKLICVGKGFRFGRRNKGNVELLKRLSDKYGYEVISVEDALYMGIPISSTRIRDAIKSGDIEGASRMLGRNYYIFLYSDSSNPSTLTPFINNVAVPGRGNYRGELVNVTTGKREQSILYVSESGFEIGGVQDLDKGNLYRFDFSGIDQSMKMAEQK
jgi:hypothetical protein